MFKIKRLIAISLILISVFVYGGELEPFVSMCIPSDATGFNWHKGNWENVNFELKRFLVKKVKNIPYIKEFKKGDDTEKFFRSSKCYEYVNTKPHIEEERVSYPICVSTKDVDRKDWMHMKCIEVHHSDDFGGDMEGFWYKRGKIAIFCEESSGRGSLAFERNGNFTKTQIHSDVFESDYKDSLSIAVGTCSDISID